MVSHIDDSCQLLPKASQVSVASSTVRVLPIVKHCEAVPQEIGPASRAELGAVLRRFHALLQDHPHRPLPSSFESSLVIDWEGILVREILRIPCPRLPPLGLLKR